MAISGIIVGVDGSGHSRRALEWAMQEAAIRRAPLTVLTVHQAIVGFYGGVAAYPDDAPSRRPCWRGCRVPGVESGGTGAPFLVQEGERTPT